MADKKYIYINTEPNVNILGLDPIMQGFWHDRMEELAGRKLSVFIYELKDSVFNAGALKEEWLGAGRFFFQRILEDHNYPGRIRNELEHHGQLLYDYAWDTIKKYQQNNLTDAEKRDRIISLFKQFTAICVPGLVAPIIECGGEWMSKKMKEIVAVKNLEVVGLSVPECIALLTQTSKHTWLDSFRENLYGLAEEISQGKESPERLKEFVEQWGWIFYGYMGPKYTVENAKVEIQNILERHQSPALLLKNLQDEFKQKITQQEEVIGKLDFSEEEKYLIRTAQDFGYTKSYRASLMGLADYAINMLLADYARAEGYSMKQLGVCTVREMSAYLSGQAALPDVNILNQRLQYCLFITRADGEEVLVGEIAKKWVAESVEIEEVDMNMKELSGMVVCAGSQTKITGIVKLVLQPADTVKMQEGDILMSTNTIPDFVPAMKKAGAIVGEVGGLTCHAAIVARELNKPCVVGVKHLLKIFKDGDKVEVDTTRGTVKKLIYD